MDALILARLKRRVEVALARCLLLSCLLFLPSVANAGLDHSELNENREPDPWPQVDLPAHSDYAEAKALLKQQKWEEAAIVLRTVFKKSPDFVPAAIELARALVYLGRREEALGCLAQTMVKVNGPRKAPLIERSRVLARMFVTQKTFQVYQDGLNLLQQSKFRLAREHFEKALEMEPDNVEILARIGECLVLEGDFDSAAERLRLAKRLGTHEPEISLWLGRALHQRGELVQAIQELKIALDGLPGSERAPIWYAEALMASGNRREAVRVLESDADARPFHLAGIVTLARIRTELFKDLSDSLWGARKDLQVALSRIPEYSASEYNRSESDLGVELNRHPAELKGEIIALLAQLDNRLRDPLVRGVSRSQR